MRPGRRSLLPILLTTGALLAAAPVLTSPPASAAETTCQGRSTTISSDQATVTGTEGADVISVGRTTVQVRALGGDDVVCAVAGSRIDAGAGDDTVVLAERQPFDAGLLTYVELGPGDDTFTGSGSNDVVDTGVAGPPDASGADAISTLGGADTVASGVAGQPDRDRVDLGAGPDSLQALLPAGSTAVLSGGADRDELAVDGDLPGSAWLFSLGTASVLREGVAVATTPGFESLTARILDADRIAVSGTPGPDQVAVLHQPRSLEVSLGAGDDLLSLGAGVRPANARGAIDLGNDPTDRLEIADPRRAKVDLGRQRVVIGTGSTAPRYAVSGTRDVTANAPVVRLVGNSRGNDLVAAGCRVRLQGGRGADDLAVLNGLADPSYTCGRAGAPRRTGSVLEGQQGRDRLSGNNRSDTLLGGPGTDRADGNGGRDRCVAERRRSCER